MPNPAPPIEPATLLLVDDEPLILEWERRSLDRIAARIGIGKVVTCGDSREVQELLRSQSVSLMLLDLGMPHLHGEEVLRQVRLSSPNTAVVVVTGEYDVSVAVRCMKAGAVDYLTKPLSYDQLVEAVRRALERTRQEESLEAQRPEPPSSVSLRQPEAFREILTDHPKMWSLFQYVEAIAKGSPPVFIWGETGSGKELVARAIHVASGVSGPFVAVNVAGLDDELFADTLFGHSVGAFTGATCEREGMISAAADGTLFLDEIGDLSDSSQVKLLRLLQESEYFSVGGDEPRRLRARIVTATHADPAHLRRDLFYRLCSSRVDVPPLRERLSDLPVLIDHFLARAAKDLGKRKPAVPKELYLYLSNYDYPGNVRELQAIVFEAMARHGKGVMGLGSFIDHIHRSRDEPHLADDAEFGTRGVVFPNPLPTLREIEEEAVAEAMERTAGNRSAAARLLGISRPTISRHMRPAR